MSARTGKHLVVLAIIAAGIYAASRPAFSVPRWSRPERNPAAFASSSVARDAQTSREWQLSTRGRRIGLITSAAVCGDEAFLLDAKLGVVHRADLITGAMTGDASARGLTSVSGLAADCHRRELYVVDGSGVRVFNMTTGAARARFARPAAFAHSTGTPVLDTVARTLSVPGTSSTRGAFPSRPADRMFEGERIGYRLDLASGRTSLMVPAVERGCWSLGPNCLFATLDRTTGSTPARWLAAHRVGMSVGVYDAGYRLLRTIDVRSPQFRENGQRNERESLKEMVAWNEDNSVIRRVFGFGDRIVTVHSFNRTRGWKPGDETNFEVFMNVHTVDGDAIASDVSLAGLPVGRDDRSLYVVDYGNGGRRLSGTDPIWLMRVDVPE